METRSYEREKLFKEVWQEPMITLATRYGISDVALRKHCKKMNIPLPKPGHWTKVKLGKEVNVPSLPEHDGPNKIEVQFRSTDNNDRFGMKMSDLLSFLSEEENQNVRKYCSKLTVPEKLIKPHDLIKDTKQYYSSKKNDQITRKFIDLSKISDGLKNRVYIFYNSLFNALEHLGYSIEIKPPQYHGYYKRNEILIRLNEDSVPIFIKEKQTRSRHIPTEDELKSRFGFIPAYDYIETGKLHFGIDSYHAKRKNWRAETKKIENQIGEIVIWIMEAIHVEKVLRKEREEEEIRRLEEQWIREEIAEKKEKELNRLKELEQYSLNWEKADRIRKFTDKVELRITGIDKEKEKEKLKSWLIWAREKADFLDPLIKKNDGVLGDGSWLINMIKDED